MTAHKGNDCIATNKGRKLNHFAMHCMGNQCLGMILVIILAIQVRCLSLIGIK